MSPFRIKPGSIERRFWSKVDKHGPTMPHMDTPCWVWTGSKTDFGHGQVRIEGELNRSHRVAWEWINGPVPVGHNVLHRCDNPPCVREEHLFLGSKADNTADMMTKGRGRSTAHRGEDNGSAKLSVKDVEEIRRLYGSPPGRGIPGPISQYELARRFGVSQGTIGFVLRGDTWR